MLSPPSVTLCSLLQLSLLTASSMKGEECRANDNILRFSQCGPPSSNRAVFAVAMLTASVIATFISAGLSPRQVPSGSGEAACVTKISTPAAAQQQTETPDEGYEIAGDNTIPILPGYRFAGVCKTLADVKFQKSSFRFFPLVKHGLHAADIMYNNCGSNRISLVHKPASRFGIPKIRKALMEIDTSSEQIVYVVPVRGERSFQKSVFNHICQKQSEKKRLLRKEHNIDCSRQNATDEAWHLFLIRGEEMDPQTDPNWIRDLLVLRRPKNLVFYDYLKLGQLTDPLCRKKFVGDGTRQINSAKAQGYKDYWSGLGNATALSINQRWDNMYKKLQAHPCLFYQTTGAS